jgi:Xylose isomerase-like TIM barrel
MPRVSINEMTTYHWSFEEDVAGYHAAGIHGIGVWRKKLSDYGEERGAELLREMGMTVTSLSCAGGFTGADGHGLHEAIDDALGALRLAAEIKAGCLVVVTGSQAGHIFNHARRLACDALRELGDAAAQLGIPLALQPGRPFERWSFVRSLEQALDLVQECRHPQVGLVFDIHQAHGDLLAAGRLNDIVPWIRVATLCNPQSLSGRTAGQGLPEEAVRAASGATPDHGLLQAGYRGWYEAQILCDKCWKSDYSRLVEDCRELLLGLEPREDEILATMLPTSDRNDAAARQETSLELVKPGPPG